MKELWYIIQVIKQGVYSWSCLWVYFGKLLHNRVVCYRISINSSQPKIILLKEIKMQTLRDSRIKLRKIKLPNFLRSVTCSMFLSSSYWKCYTEIILLIICWLQIIFAIKTNGALMHSKKTTMLILISNRILCID